MSYKSMIGAQIELSIKLAAQRILEEKYNLNLSQALRLLFEYVAEHKKLPEQLQKDLQAGDETNGLNKDG